ncbi:CheR family methyltransferase [Ectothiorhodospira lacustris]|uniref:CheR family methyltransferase n=1 Tax=Ectothiorhodospira lacustris TaxID=2899127 RepID=UPI001EE8FB04|nr:protein-glutamate O-methyltransferase CheR [Ectothiorhodospira lacustris]MCG5499838.1 protein-glutamate O-methyltransferase CheR [Ectothiorhodospira lacustris]MCG5511029.1 protein-glutamate O-methyltransferase CheR [Ectothiorhodospira lacustris]MCG5522759.1 protein-glutamate O-methyltransferase CheR [Ectothiorhodospira lacustris]
MSGPIESQDYEDFRLFLEKSCGLVLGENKHYLVNSRLSRLMGEFSVSSVSDLLRQLKLGRNPGLRERVIEAMTTNETYWFRDVFPFEILKNQIYPELAKQKGSGYAPRIWCAACSSGQEPYSISMGFSEYQQSRPGSLRDVQILGTDISGAVLKESREASYDSLAVARGLSLDRRNRFFVQNGDRWVLRPDIKARASFREFNLMDSYTLLGRFDVVFCRNVLIYFSIDSKKLILKRISQILNPGGYLFLGASESMANYSDAFEMVRCNPGVVYRLR